MSAFSFRSNANSAARSEAGLNAAINTNDSNDSLMRFNINVPT